LFRLLLDGLRLLSGLFRLLDRFRFLDRFRLLGGLFRLLNGLRLLNGFRLLGGLFRLLYRFRNLSRFRDLCGLFSRFPSSVSRISCSSYLDSTFTICTNKISTITGLMECMGKATLTTVTISFVSTSFRFSGSP